MLLRTPMHVRDQRKMRRRRLWHPQRQDICERSLAAAAAEEEEAVVYQKQLKQKSLFFCIQRRLIRQQRLQSLRRTCDRIRADRRNHRLFVERRKLRRGIFIKAYDCVTLTQVKEAINCERADRRKRVSTC